LKKKGGMDQTPENLGKLKFFPSRGKYLMTAGGDTEREKDDCPRSLRGEGERRRVGRVRGKETTVEQKDWKVATAKNMSREITERGKLD